MNEIDCWRTDTVICPYCGADNGGSDGDGPPKGRQQCDSCELNFDCEPDFSVNYSTRKVDCWNGGPHNWMPTEFFASQDSKGIRNCKTCYKSEWINRE